MRRSQSWRGEHVSLHNCWPGLFGWATRPCGACLPPPARDRAGVVRRAAPQGGRHSLLPGIFPPPRIFSASPPAGLVTRGLRGGPQSTVGPQSRRGGGQPAHKPAGAMPLGGSRAGPVWREEIAKRSRHAPSLVRSFRVTRRRGAARLAARRPDADPNRPVHGGLNEGSARP
jgi:hypothetical protein